ACLEELVRHGDPAVFNQVFEHQKLNPYFSCKKRLGYLLWLAASQNQVAIMLVLLDANAEINVAQNDQYLCDFVTKNWPEQMFVRVLKVFACNNNLAAVSVMLEKRPKLVDVPDEAGITALMLAVSMADKALVKILLEKGANPNLAFASGQTAISIAADNNDQELLALFNTHQTVSNQVANFFGSLFNRRAPDADPASAPMGSFKKA
ncbi:MAG: ankyrin repeat domain-containing protein, partial [Coxiellaceae bacterium]|nr:ankyrin repeat domain-containing protein [Coxiellaceae bacterium]